VCLRRLSGVRENRVAQHLTLETDTMAHNPVNHPLRPIYRALGFLVGAYLVVFGIVGLIQTSGHDFTGKIGVRVLGQEANLLWSVISLILGAIILIATVIGRNADTEADKFLGWAVLVFGAYGLATTRTDADFLGFSISTVVVTFLVGIVLITTSLYSKVAPAAQAGAPRQVREGRPA
jgi:hypothetical protein